MQEKLRELSRELKEAQAKTKYLEGELKKLQKESGGSSVEADVGLYTYTISDHITTPTFNIPGSITSSWKKSLSSLVVLYSYKYSVFSWGAYKVFYGMIFLCSVLLLFWQQYLSNSCNKRRIYKCHRKVFDMTIYVWCLHYMYCTYLPLYFITDRYITCPCCTSRHFRMYIDT